MCRIAHDLRLYFSPDLAVRLKISQIASNLCEEHAQTCPYLTSYFSCRRWIAGKQRIDRVEDDQEI